LEAPSKRHEEIGSEVAISFVYFCVDWPFHNSLQQIDIRVIRQSGKVIDFAEPTKPGPWILAAADRMVRRQIVGKPSGGTS
jgi:hypothetical protein